MVKMRRNSAKSMAFGGVTAALAMVIICLGGLIPVATYVCPMLCCLILLFVTKLCGNRIGWAWYGAVSIIGLMIGPDKEAAIVFLALGYYPIIKPELDKLRFRWAFKFLLFNVSICIAYAILIFVMGVEGLSLGTIGTVLMVVLILMGNLTFFLLDRLLAILSLKLERKKGR